MYIQQPKELKLACFGALMGTRLKQIGAGGVVVDGRFRDIREMQDLGLPVSCYPRCTLSTLISHRCLHGQILF